MNVPRLSIYVHPRVILNTEKNYWTIYNEQFSPGKHHPCINGWIQANI